MLARFRSSPHEAGLYRRVEDMCPDSCTPLTKFKIRKRSKEIYKSSKGAILNLTCIAILVMPSLTMGGIKQQIKFSINKGGDPILVTFIHQLQILTGRSYNGFN